MNKSILFFIIPLITLFSCSIQELPSINEQINGIWKLNDINQLKDSQNIVLQKGNSTFEFQTNSVTIEGDTYLHESGKYSYLISSENYFNAELAEPKNTILVFGNQKYILEVDYDSQNMFLTNYTDGKIKYHLSK